MLFKIKKGWLCTIITNPFYNITATILKLITSILEKIGEINAKFLDKPSPTLKKQYKNYLFF